MILLIGDSSSVHLYNYISQILISYHSDILIFDYISENKEGYYSQFYKINNIKVIFGIPQNKLFNKIPLLYKIYKHTPLLLHYQIKKLKLIGNIDLCQVHYISYHASILAQKVRIRTNKLILNFWGSDLFRANQKLVNQQKKTMAMADNIIVSTYKMKEEFNKIYGKNFNEKLSVIKFVSTTINKISYRPFELKDKICITCGYNASPAQQHNEIIHELDMLSIEAKSKIRLLFPMTYGIVSENYVSKLCDNLENTKIEYSILRKYCTPEEMIELSNETDIYLHLVKTDAFSGTMQEMLCSGAIMVKGKWLEYNELTEAGLYFHEIDSFQELVPLIEYLIKDIDSHRKKCINNANLIKSISSTDVIKQKYKKILSTKYKE